MNCKTVVSYYNGQPEFCYKQTGHTGKCFKTFGLEMEYLVKEVLKASGLLIGNPELPKDMKIQDGAHKIDFWIISDNQKFPIQFTVSKRDYWKKAKDAYRRGIAPLCVSEDDLLKWQWSSNKCVKKQIEEAIRNEVIGIIEKLGSLPNFQFAEPRFTLSIPIMS
jgi:hypothetical protein